MPRDIARPSRKPPAMAHPYASEAYWARAPEELCRELGSTPRGLDEQEAIARLARFGRSRIEPPSEASTDLRIASRQFRSPLVLLLLAATIVSYLTGDARQALVIAGIVLASAALGFLQERRASRSIAALQSRLRTASRVRRSGQICTIPFGEVVPGDVIELSAGSLVPADGVLLACRDCFVVQAALTGESLPVSKTVEPSPPHALPVDRSNVLYLGSSVRSGTATLLAVNTGPKTLFGGLAAKLKQQRPPTDFERGMSRFSLLLTQLVLLITLVVTAINLSLHHAAAESLLFAVALAVGMTPELLPAIVTYTLSRGARSMAAKGVLVRQLSAIENLGSMTVLCTDKTGTLTSGAMRLAAAIDADAAAAPRVAALAVVNARLQGGMRNPLDDLLMTLDGGATRDWVKVDEIPYDFQRRRITVTIAMPDGNTLAVCKGAADSVLAACTRRRRQDEAILIEPAERARLEALVDAQARQGHRVLAVATGDPRRAGEKEQALTFEGLLLFDDPLKPGVPQDIERLKGLGVLVKIVTGDRAGTAVHVARAIGIDDPRVMTGEALRGLTADALWNMAPGIDVFAEIDPAGKERIIHALRARGSVVGYLGDGINDAPALHVADVGLSVEGAVDVAREAADLVLLRPDLGVIADGIVEGRHTFANTQKYILSTSSANLGNMLSMALASWVLPFLPLTAAQILLNNVLSDVPALTLGIDRVESDALRSPPRWSVRQIRRFTLVFGLVSSAFDAVTFLILLSLPSVQQATFRSGWFLESLVSEVLVLLIVRTRLPVWRARPGITLVFASIAVLLGATALVQSDAGRSLGFEPLPLALLGTVAGIAIVYAACVEVLKRRLYSLAS